MTNCMEAEAEAEAKQSKASSSRRYLKMLSLERHSHTSRRCIMCCMTGADSVAARCCFRHAEACEQPSHWVLHNRGCRASCIETW
mmetsp:Transcript_116871/g.232924  ORF Transcript_116871/g.232924 Transcript_116871/m.232924 type:complete len:85 (-) Transcript_116871:851-1105(-)